MAKLANVLCVQSSTLGGMQEIARWLARTAGMAGHTVTEISTPLMGWQQNEWAFALAGELFQTARVSAKSFLQRGQHDGFLVHSPIGWAPGPGLTIFHSNIAEYVRTNYTPLQPNYWRLRLLNENYERLAAVGSRINISLTHFQTSWLKSLGIRVDEVVYNPIDTHEFAPANDQAACRSRLGIPNDTFVALCVGRPCRRKAWPRVLTLVNSFPSVFFLFVGVSCHDIGSLPANCMAVGSKPRSELPSYYRAADALVLLSSSECCSLVMLEAMASGLSVFSTYTGLAADLYGLGEPFNLAITRELAEDRVVFKRLLDSPNLRKELGEASRGFVIKNCEQELVAARYRELILQALSAG